MQWKIPQNGNVGTLHDSKLQNVWYFLVSLQFAERKLNKFNRRVFIANRFSFKITVLVSRYLDSLWAGHLSRTGYSQGGFQKVYVLERVACKIDNITSSPQAWDG